MKIEKLTGELLAQWETYCQEIKEKNQKVIEETTRVNDAAMKKYFEEGEKLHSEFDERKEQYSQALKQYQALPWYRKRWRKKPEEPYFFPPFRRSFPHYYMPLTQIATWEGFLTWLAKKR